MTRCLALAAGVVCLSANVVWSPWLGYLAFLLTLVAVLWGLGGKSLVKAFVPAGLMLLTILPPPLGWDQIFTLWLRSLAVDTSSTLLDLLRITHAQDGNTLQLPGKTLLVAEACSGINSFILCNAFCLFWLLWQRRSLWWLCLALPATSLFVVLGNVIRITAGAAGYYFWQVNLLDGWQHEMFGLALLLGYCVLVLSLDQLLVFATQSSGSPGAVPGDKTVSLSAGTIRPECRSWPVLGFKFAGPLLAVLGLGMFSAHLVAGGRHGLAALPNLRSSPELNLSLPDHLAGWQRVNANSGDLSLVQTLGVHSIGWHFQREGITAVVSVDYPLDGFHNVKMCYINNGWQVMAEDELRNPQNQEDLHAIRLTLEQTLRHAVVLHSVMDERGVWLAPPKALATRFADSTTPVKGYRIQLITGGYAPLSDDEAAAAQALFFQARQTLARQMVDQLRKTAAK